MRRSTLLTAAVAVAAAFALAGQPAAAGGPTPDRFCGILPGQGAYDYIKMWGPIRCGRARGVSHQAYLEFCGRQDRRCNIQPGEKKVGRVKQGAWTCRMRVEYEQFRGRCFKGRDRNPRFVHARGS
jgi:hypothetical protein